MPYIGRHLDRGNYLKLDDISSSFDGVETTFNLTNGGSPFYPGSAFSILVVLAGVIQEAESAYQIDQSQITFASAPLASDSFFCIVLGTALGINVPGNGTVGGTQLTKPFSYDGFFYLNDTTNRVGINSSSPTTALDVQGTVTATEFVGNLSNTSGISTFYNLTVENDLTVNGSFSTLDTIVTEVDKLEVGANNSTVGVAITQSGSGDILRLYDSTTQVVTVADGGKVGIGSSVPQEVLDVNGRGRFQGSTSSATSGSGLELAYVSGTTTGRILTFNRSTSTYLPTDITGNPLTFSIGTNEKVRITSSGNVGIGTNNPATNFKLDVNGDLSLGEYNGSDNTYIDQKQNGHLNIINSGVPGNTGAVRINKTNTIGGDTTYFRDFVVYDGKNNVVQFIDGSSGNVGIGTDNASKQVHIESAIPYLRLQDNTASSKRLDLWVEGSYGYIGCNQSAQNLYLQTTNETRLAILSDGKVGIGTDIPTSKLYIRTDDGVSIRGNSGTTDAFINLQPATGGRAYHLRTSTSSFELFDASANTSRMYWNYDGRTGINTASPGTELHVHGTNGYAELRLSGQSGSGGSLEYYDHTTKLADIFADSSSNIIFRNTASNSERLRINSSGNVGINTTTPADTLDVNGNVLPSFDATHDLGSASKRWNNVYTTDLQLSNEGSSNDVDGSWGRWTIQEGEDDLFLINRRNGKKYKFVLQEVN